MTKLWKLGIGSSSAVVSVEIIILLLYWVAVAWVSR